MSAADTIRHNGDDDESEERIPPRPNIFCTAFTILLWYIISTATIISTKWLFTNHFRFHLTVTMFTNVVASFWALMLSCHPRLRPQQPLTKQILLGYVLPIGVCIALEISCSNFALKLLSVSFGTILKGGAPIFTFAWGMYFRLEQFSWSVMVALITIALGIALASLGEGQEFQALGFCLQLFATSLAGLRWAMTHKLLKGRGPEASKMSPLTATLYTCPTTALCVLPFALVLEAKSIWADSTLKGNEAFLVLAVLVGIATLVFTLLMSEYWLVNATSSLALSVTGVFKELLTIGGGIFIFSEHIDLLNVVGFVTCQVGILTYVNLRYDNEPPDVATYAPVTEPVQNGSNPSIQQEACPDDRIELSAFTIT